VAKFHKHLVTPDKMKKTIPRRSLTTIFSGIQPTGIPHLGNYLGAVSNWVRLQQTNTDRVLYSVVDLHALTLPQEPSVLRADILNATATLLACGVSPERSCVFQQSTVKEHAELAWLLSCITPKGWLNRMTQYKDKKEKGAGEQASLGLYSYPVLMAADILLYNTTHVPVGHDQKQHLELARDIAIKFNSNQIKGGVFNIPVGIFSEGTSTRVMSLNDGTKKMSKSDPSSLSRINLDDAPDEIMKKIKKAKTDGERGFLSATTSEGEIMRPEVNNLLGIRAALEDKSVQEVALELDGRDASTKMMKDELTEIIVNRVHPIATEIERLREDKPYLSEVLSHGTRVASEIAADTMLSVRSSIGIL
jgi:tryptophanyl-tRNA synthetase